MGDLSRPECVQLSRSRSSVCSQNMVFRIDNFRALVESNDTGHFIRSCIYYVGGRKFSLMFFPSGVNATTAGWCTVLIVCEDARLKHPVTMHFSCHINEVREPVWREPDTWKVIRSPGGNAGAPLVPTAESKLLSTRCADSLQVEVCMRVYGEHSRTRRTEHVLEPHYPCMKASLESLFNHGCQGGDVTIRTDEGSFSAHSFVLTLRSDVMKKMISMDGEIVMRTCSQVAREFVRFLYCDRTELLLTIDGCAHLLQLGKFFLVGDIADAVTHNLQALLSGDPCLDSVAEFSLLAHSLSMPAVWQAAVSHMSKKFFHLRHTRAWKKLLSNDEILEGLSSGVSTKFSPY